MLRAQFRDTVMLRTASGVLSLPPRGASAFLCDVGGSAPISELIYSDESSGTTLDNPLSLGLDGTINFWTAEERELDVVVSCSGFITSRVTVTTDSATIPGQGPTGPQGPQGEEGPVGPAGAQGPAGPGIVWRDQFDNSVSYAPNDAVYWQGSSYITAVPIAAGGAGPGTDARWDLMARIGLVGPQGPQGDTGLQGPQGIQGSPGNAGAMGPQGPQGAIGATGAAGLGVPAGGATGTVLTKLSAADNDTSWIMPSGGGGGLTIPLSQNLTFAPDATYDIGAAAASRPRNIYATGSIVAAASGSPLTLGAGSSGAFIVPSVGGNLQFGANGAARWYVDFTTGSWYASTDAAVDVGASGAHRPRDLFMSRNALIGGTTQSVGVASIGATAPNASTALLISGSLTSGSTQIGLNLNAQWNVLATTAATSLQINWWSGAATYTTANGYGLRITAPLPGAGNTVTNLYGINVANQGSSGVVNTYGIFIAAQSGASTTNIGLYNGGTSQFMANVGIGATPAAYSGLVVTPGPSQIAPSGGWAYGIQSQPTFPSGTSLGAAVIANVLTQAVAFTLVTALGVYVLAPSLGAGSAITNAIGVQIDNQGGAGRTNAYGLWVAAQGGSSGDNKAIVIGGANEYIRNPKNNASSLSIESSDGFAQLQGKAGALVALNAYYDGSQWQRFDVSSAAMHINLGTALNIYSAPAGANPIVWTTTMMSLDSIGNLHATSLATGPAFGGGWPIAGDINISRGGSPASGYIFFADGSHYLGWTGSQFSFLGGSVSSSNGMILNTGRAANQANISWYSSNGSGTNYDIAQFVESGFMYFWATRPDAQYYFQASVNGGWGTCHAAAFTVESTIKSKHDLQPFNQQTALAQVLDERATPLAFSYNATPGRHLGFVAEDMAQVVPEVVTRDETGDPQGIHYGALVPVLWSALREVTTRLEDVERKLAA
jgi:hypothetical protein